MVEAEQATANISSMAEEEQAIAKAFPVKPNLKPTSRPSSLTLESKYWKSFKPQPIKTLISSITSLSFSPTPPHDFTVAHSATVTIFFVQSPEPRTTLSTFTDTAISASFRSDDCLLAAGSFFGLVQVFDVRTRTTFCQLRGHALPVHLICYPHLDKFHLLSGGNDAVVKY